MLKQLKLEDYQGSIVLKVSSQFGRYEYRFALDDSAEDQVMHTTANDLIL